MQAHRLPARRGMVWLQASYALYRRNPPLLTSATMLYLIVLVGLGLLPYFNEFLLPLLMPTLALMVANVCRMVDRGDPPSGKGLVAGIAEYRVALMYLGLFQLIASCLLRLVSNLIEGGPVYMPDPEQVDLLALFGLLARTAILALPLVMAVWFAPMLAAWDRIPAQKALFFSFVASFRNWRAFVIYGVVVGIVAIALPGLLMVLITAMVSSVAGDTIAFVLRLLLIMVLVPVLMAASYVSYVDIFVATSDKNEVAENVEKDASNDPTKSETLNE